MGKLSQRLQDNETQATSSGQKGQFHDSSTYLPSLAEQYICKNNQNGSQCKDNVSLTVVNSKCNSDNETVLR